MTRNSNTERASITRRSLVVSAGLLTSLGLFGCSIKPKSTIPEVMSKDKEWQSAYDEAIECWETLQSDMSDASDYLTQLQGQRAKDPDSVTALQNAVDSASTLEDEVSDLSAPKDAKKLAKSTKKLEELAKSYKDASSAIASAKNAIEVIKPGQGSFDHTNRDGYTYRVEYAIDPDITIDSSEGKPGYVGLSLDFSNSMVTVTNTTSGKRAPGVIFDLIPLYTASAFGLAEGNCGPLNNPSEFDEYGKIPIDSAHTGAQLLYVNPFDYGNPGAQQSDFPWGQYLNVSFKAGIPSDPYGMKEFDVGESRELTCSTLNNVVHICDVSSESAETFKNPVAWCLMPVYGGVQGTAVFRVVDRFAAYNPVG